MKKTYVKDIMVPVSDYATVSKTADLFETILALESEKKKFGEKPYRHQSVLVVDERGHVIGKVSQMDIMAALEPNYSKIGENIKLSRLGFSPTFIRAMQDQYHLWKKPLEELCRNVESVNVTKIMYTPADDQKVKKTDTLDNAMHHILMGRHHSLLVTSGNRIVGILRSTDVFNCLYDKIIACGR